MVLYRWINYFIELQREYCRYLRFLTPSLIFVTEFPFLCIYPSEDNAVDPRLSKREFTRGISILGIFLVPNLARTFHLLAMRVGIVVGNLQDAGNTLTVLHVGISRL